MTDENSNLSGRSPEPRTAPSPFNNASTDIILRTSDHVDFHVYSQILVAASPVFEGMFELPQPPAQQQELKYGRPIIRLSEDSGAMETLLRIIYPINKPTRRTVEEVEPALRAAMKFEMELAITVLTQDLQAAAHEHPMQVWATSCRLGLEDMAKTAARVLVPAPVPGWGQPAIRPLTFEELGEMRGLSAGDYYRLFEFHRLAGEVALDFKFLSPACDAPWSSSAAQPGTASSPGFRGHIPNPDLICRSSDDAQFPAHRAILCAASASLAEQVERAGPVVDGTAISTPTPIVPLEEDGVVVAAILKICYHDAVDDLLSSVDLPLLLRIFSAIERYGLADMHARFLSRWRDMVKTTPLQTYCVTVGAGNFGLAKEAARQVVHIRLEGAYVGEMEGIPALSYHRLWTYYRSCQQLATERLQNTLNVLSIPSQPSSNQPVVSQPQNVANNGPPSWSWGPVRIPPLSSTDSVSEPEKTWIRRYVRQMLDVARAGPHVPFSPLQELLVKASEHADPSERFWCDRCQPLAEDLIKADADFKNLVAAMDAVSCFPLSVNLYSPAHPRFHRLSCRFDPLCHDAPMSAFTMQVPKSTRASNHLLLSSGPRTRFPTCLPSLNQHSRFVTSRLLIAAACEQSVIGVCCRDRDHYL